MELGLFVLILTFQSATIAFFYSLFFSMKRRFSFFWKMTLFMMIVVYPVNNLIPSRAMIFRNVFNCALEFLFLCQTIRQEPKKRLLFGILLCQIALVVSEILAVSFTYFLLHRPPELAEFDALNMGDMFSVYLFASCLLLLLLFGMIRGFSKARLASVQMSGYLISLMLNVILVALCACHIFEPFNVLFFLKNYWIVLGVLFIINLFTFLSLFHYVKQKKQKKSMELLENEYVTQMRFYLETGANESALRHFRHDLLNFLEKQQF